MGLLMLVLVVALPSSLALNSNMKPAEFQQLTSELGHGIQYFEGKAQAKQPIQNEEAKTKLTEYTTPKGEFRGANWKNSFGLRARRRADLTTMGTIFLADNFGLPVSTTHVLTSGIAGTMFANRSGLQKSTLRNILLAWVLTLPVCFFLDATIFAGMLLPYPAALRDLRFLRVSLLRAIT
jgi:hypothetical protein